LLDIGSSGVPVIMANVLLIPIGSFGDVHPFVGLGLALRERGHRVTVLTSVHFDSLITRAGLEFIGLGTEEEYQAVLLHPDAWDLRKGFQVVFRGFVLPWMRRIYDLIAERYVAGETVVAASPLAFGARLAHEKLGVPLVSVELQPSMLRSLYQSPVVPGMALPGWLPRVLKRLAYWLGDVWVIDPVIVPETNAVRAELGLPPIRRPLHSWFHSPQRIIALYPRWYAPMQPDWPKHLAFTGFPQFDERGLTEVAPEVLEFLEGGRPVVFTPGSAMRQGRPFFEAAAEACRLIGRRGMLLTRYPEQVPSSLPEGVRHFSYVPFSQLLPRAAALVHHGGIGTIAQAMAAGLPQLVMPMSYDQPDNAARLNRLGIGRSLPPERFRGPAVAQLLDELLNSPDVAIRCREVAQQLQGIDPIGDTCKLIEELVSQPAAVAAPGKGP
jgi:UDP:flavonoid glycosyltransferase YjiC (YdhE family)